MIKLQKLTKTIPSGDYVLEKEDALEKTVRNLTPKFEGKWTVIMIDPSIVFTLELIDNTNFPEWVDVLVLTNRKKMDRITEVKPAFAPKEETVYEAYQVAIQEMSHMITSQASKYLFSALRSNKEALLSTLHKLDVECETDIIEIKAVQAEVVKPNIVWASSVVDAFLTYDRNRWKMYEKLVNDVGINIAYYATRKYVNKILKEKNAYLHNEDVHARIVGNVPATEICRLYSLIATTNNPKLLSAIYMQFDNRSNVNIEED